MTTGDPAHFSRRRWDLFTRSQITRARVTAHASSSDILVPSELDGDYPPVPCRAYTPTAMADSAASTPSPPGKRPSGPALLFFHGGGMVIQSEVAKQSDDLVLQLVRRLGWPAYSVGYRLSPGHRFPCGLRDAYARRDAHGALPTPCTSHWVHC